MQHIYFCFETQSWKLIAREQSIPIRQYKYASTFNIHPQSQYDTSVMNSNTRS